MGFMGKERTLSPRKKANLLPPRRDGGRTRSERQGSSRLRRSILCEDAGGALDPRSALSPDSLVKGGKRKAKMF